MNPKRLILSLLVVAFLAACTFGSEPPLTDSPPAQPVPGSTASQTTQDLSAVEPAAPQPVTLLTADGQEVTFTPPPPDALQVIRTRVTAGDYTLPQAAIAALRLRVSEDPGLNLFDGQVVSGLPGWRLSALAVEAYPLASAPEQAELQRLYDKIVLSPEILEAISAPADSAGARSPGLASPARQVDCTTLWEEGFSPSETTLCLLYIEFTDSGNTYRVYYPIDRRGDPAFMAFVEAAADALRESVHVYGELTELHNLDLIFTAITPPDEEEDVEAFVPGLTSTEITSRSCPVMVLSDALTGTADDHFKQVIAHEVFHCVQYWRQGHSTSGAADWYIEGTAEYFSGVVYPDSNNEHQFLSGFNYFTATESLLDLQYSSWVFFQYLGSRFGHDFVIGLLDVLPTAGGRSAQAAALAAVGDMPNTFHEFSQAFLDGQLRDENGALLPLSPLYLPRNLFILTPSPAREFTARDFQISRYQLTYEEAKQYLIDMELSGEEGLFTARPAGGGDWGSLPLELRVGCEDLRYIGLVTNTSAGSEYSATARTQWPEENLCDRCLIGTWMMDTPEIEALFRSTAASENIVSVRGQFFLEIDESRMKFTPMGYGAKFQAGDETVDMAMEGSSTGLYVIPAEGKIFAVQEMFDFIATVTNSAGTFTVPIGPEIVAMLPSPFDFGPIDPFDPADVYDPAEIFAGLGDTSAEYVFTYTCSETTLTSYPPPGLGAPSSSTYTRVSTP